MEGVKRKDPLKMRDLAKGACLWRWRGGEGHRPHVGGGPRGGNIRTGDIQEASLAGLRAPGGWTVIDSCSKLAAQIYGLLQGNRWDRMH